MGNNVCCSDSKVDNVTFVSLKPGTFNENKASLFSGQESPDAGYFELENATGKTIAVKVAHGSAPALWNNQPLKDMVVVPPKHHVCAYFDPSRTSMEVFVLYGESANVEEAEGVSWARRAQQGAPKAAADSGVATWKSKACFSVACQGKNVVCRYLPLERLELVTKGIVRDLLLLKHSTRSGVDTDTNASQVRKIALTTLTGQPVGAGEDTPSN